VVLALVFAGGVQGECPDQFTGVRVEHADGEFVDQ
jgi:hypothetical protein